jgi:hypothetical protein
MIRDFHLGIEELGAVGRNLSRPENVLAFRDGTVFASSNQGHIVRIDPDGRQWKIGALPGGQPTTMALESDEALLVNNTADGNVYRLRLDGRHEIFLDSIDGTDRRALGPDPLGETIFPDGIALDTDGNVWIAAVSHNGLMIVSPDGEMQTVFEQPVPDALSALTLAHTRGTIPMSAIAAVAGQDLRLLTSVGFGGPELKTVFMGSLAMPHLVSFPSPIPGLPLAHQKRPAAPPQPASVVDGLNGVER